MAALEESLGGHKKPSAKRSEEHGPTEGPPSSGFFTPGRYPEDRLVRRIVLWQISLRNWASVFNPLWMSALGP